MPHSARENDAYVRAFVQDMGIHTVLDIGAGSGTYARLLGDLCTLDAVEAWLPYVEQFGLTDLYREVTLIDARHLSATSAFDRKYDLIIFGDVLEHMTRTEALALWAWAGCVATWGMISVPVVHWPQGAEEGNPFEVHVQEHLRPEDIRKDYGPFAYDQIWELTGTFIRRFE